MTCIEYLLLRKKASSYNVRLGDFIKALDNLEKCAQLGKNYYQLRTDANIYLTCLYMRLAEQKTDIQTLQYIIEVYETSTKEYETSYKLRQTYLALDDIESPLNIMIVVEKLKIIKVLIKLMKYLLLVIKSNFNK